jgi:hypothetical protein
MANQHGHTDIVREGQLFICRPQGGFNMEGAKEYEIAFAQEVVHVIHKPWAIMEVLENFEAASPDVMRRIGAQFTWCAQNNCRWLAIVSESALMQHLAQRYLEPSGLNIKIFTDEAEALTWLNAHLGKASDEDVSSVI